MMSRSTFILTVLLLCSTATLVLSSKSHAITTLLNAKWSAPPIYLEIAEFLGLENDNFYWDYINSLVNQASPISNVENDQKRYKIALDLASSVLQPTQQNILKLSLALHSLTPLIQSHFEISKEAKKVSGCHESVFVQTRAKFICDLQGLSNIGGKNNYEDTDMPDFYEFDHVYPGSNTSDNIVILYGDVGTNEFSRWYKVLKTRVEQGHIRLIIRNYVDTESSRKVRLSGYGVELHLKSTEYKSQDDSDQPASDQPEPEEDQDDDEVEGINFKTLR